jgi:ferredoxin-NADP reductase
MADRDEAITFTATQPDTLTVTGKRVVAEGVVHLELRRPDRDRLPDWTAGAHIDVILPDGTTRQYSLLGDPHNPSLYEIAVLREPDGRGGSRYVHDELHEGDTVGFGGPRNNFRIAPSPRYRFIAGGIGITPILPMLRTAETFGSNWDLLYLGRDRATMPFLDELAEAYGQRIHAHTSAELGRADIAAWLGGYDPETKAYACGPASLLTAFTDATASWRPGWSRTERFAAVAHEEPARTTSFEVQVLGSEQIIVVEPGTPVAGALRDAGFEILTSCSRGVCGTCETAVVAGEPDHRDSILDDTEREAGTCFFPCVSRSKSDRIVLAL